MTSRPKGDRVEGWFKSLLCYKSLNKLDNYISCVLTKWLQKCIISTHFTAYTFKTYKLK